MATGHSMQYAITMLTFAAPLRMVGSTGLDQQIPAVPRDGFANATKSQIIIEDDDATFNYMRNGDSRYPQETQQTLVSGVTLGSSGQTLPAGSQISGHHATILIDDLGNRFYFMLTAVAGGENQPPVVVGNNYAALIVPIPARSNDGIETWPQFDPSRSFKSGGTLKIGVSNSNAVSFDPGSVVAPPEPCCFTPGVMIATLRGDIAIEHLKVGDLVQTRDGGLRPLRWIGSTWVSRARLDLQPNLRPIKISAGALGPDLPARDLTVSPQHRVLVCSKIAERMFGESEMLVSAKHLVRLPGISVQADCEGITYIHMMFDRHEIVRSDGAWTESFLFGPQAERTAPPAMIREIRALFPDLPFKGSSATARGVLTGREARELLMRHAKNRRDLVCAE